MEDNSGLILNIDEKINSVRTKSLDLSFSELANMYQDKELVISPEYQRLFRWSIRLQSQFIESLILEMPIPPIFVIETSDRIYELIDGLQRISSWLHFLGLSPKYPNKKLILTDCDIIAGLNGKTFDELPKSLQIKVKRSYIRVEVIKKESTPRIKYDMFRRLNTNGLQLSHQEIRNCTIRLLTSGNIFLKFISDLSQNNHFKNCINPVQEYDIERKYDEELVIRFFAIKNYLSNYNDDLSDFFTSFSEHASEHNSSFDYSKEKIIFEKVFEILAKTLGEHSFEAYNNKNNYSGQFHAHQFEAFTIGIVDFIDKIDVGDLSLLSKIGNSFIELKSSDAFRDLTKTGDLNKKNRRLDRLKKRIEIVSNTLRGLL